jgi:hypothetical protein
MPTGRTEHYANRAEPGFLGTPVRLWASRAVAASRSRGRPRTRACTRVRSQWARYPRAREEPRTIGFFAFTAIGFAAFIAAHFNQDGVVSTASDYRAQGVLKRIAAAPISPTSFILTQVLTRLAVGLLQTLAFLAAAAALGVHIA